MARGLPVLSYSQAMLFPNVGGAARLVEARLRHGEDTLRKVVKKQQFQLVEKVVAGVDRAARQNKHVEARRRVRAVALEVLAEASERALATL